jgi:hypothetical protein
VPSTGEIRLLLRMAEANLSRPLSDLDRQIRSVVEADATRFRRDPEASVVCGWIAGYLARASRY